MSDFLSTMAESSLLRAGETKARSGVTGLFSRALSARPVVPLRLSEAGFDLIAETKLASPSDGPLARTHDQERHVVGLARLYKEAGSAAVSVLTEPSRFNGALDHLESVSAAVDLPMMRKDFLVDPIQVIEARAAGASGVLLIARLTEQALLVEMTGLALSYGMFVLVEIFDEEDLERASTVFDHDILLGVNTRDLTTLQVDPKRLEVLASLLPSQLTTVAESGITTAEDAESVVSLGYRMALVGTALVTSADPKALTGDLIAAGRRARTAGSAK
jgi:indole-3-glycerol phosphate synthase